MSLMASVVPTLCEDQVRPPSFVRLRNPPSPAIQPRFESEKKTAFKSFLASPRRAAVQPAVCALVAETPASNISIRRAQNFPARKLFLIENIQSTPVHNLSLYGSHTTAEVWRKFGVKL
jgi:hypothetical protein